ncbi:MAG: hypothetical protein RBT74_02030 [Tenuifilaceae bacterium]|nr:hypothetical protein [Tenuifilaceae bacterium]
MTRSNVVRALICLALWLSSQSVFGQRITSFSGQPELFATEINDLVKNQLNKEEGDIPKEFETFWMSDTLSVEQKERIIGISDLILKKTAVNTRHLITLIKILPLYSKQKKFQSEMQVWLRGLENYAQADNIPISWISQFLENSFALFTRGSFTIYPAYEWKVSNSNFNYVFDQTLTIRFFDTNLISTNKTDSIAILSTEGIFYPSQDKWVGKGGKVTWIRSRFPVDEIFATLSNYTINTTRNEYEADSVLFTNLDYFSEPSLGRLKDKISGATNPDNVIYPEFHTYHQRHKIPNFFDGVDFDGGYFMQGTQFVGNGTRENPAVLEIRKNNMEFLRVESQTYIFRRLTVVSDYARVRFKFENDSLYHTGLNFTYNDQTRTVTIAPTNLLTTQSPILSTYHNLSINFGQLEWKQGQNEMVFSAPIGSSQSRALFESNNFFNEHIFDELMSRDEQHPLFAVSNYTRRIQSKEFKVEEFARYVRKSTEQVRIQIMRLAMLGYLLYEFETGDIYVLPKLYDALRAKGKFIDYDVIKFSSYVQSGANAVLDLTSLEMAVRGVENVSVSDSQNVFLYPARREIILKKNRNFSFDGMVVAGMFTFYGKNFEFDYANFKINSEFIDSLRLNYQTKDLDFYGRRILDRVTSTLEVISGEIVIDKPNNKSGLVINEEYPIFNSKGHSFVYYDDVDIFNGVYNRKNFYFKINPFTFYGINNFEISNMAFTGVFFSADIFAPITDTLILRPDNSLGFRRTFPSEGYAIYQGKGRYYNQIDLSNSGLRGTGQFDYITSTTSSDEIFFFPDSLTTISTLFALKRQDQGIQYPVVQGKEHIVKWYPYREKLFAFKGKESFQMFENQAKLLGNLTLEPLGLVGDGLFDMGKARLRSATYNFNAIDVNAQLADAEFDITTSNELAFTAPSVKAHVDFDKQQGEFFKVNESIFADIPPLMYKSYLDQFVWAIDKSELTIITPTRQKSVEQGKFYVNGMPKADSIPVGSAFYSLHRDEDSLYFFSPKVRYNLNQPNLKADSVKYLQIADALIYPGNQKIEVDAKRRMLPFGEAKIVANLTDRFHNFYNANVTVTSRKRYTASATIDYVDENEKVQSIKLKDIKVDTQGNTYAQSSVTEPDSFKLSPYFGYIGDFEIFAQNKHWLFTGGATPIHPCNQLKTSNISFKAEIDPKNIFIPIPQLPRNINQNILISGSVITVDSIHLYPSFLSGRKDHPDRTLVSAEGFMHYNKNRSRFIIGEKSKIINPDTTGNLISLSRDFCMLFSEGQVNIPVNLGQMKHISSGGLTHLLADSILNMDLVLALQFHFNQQSLEAMATDILAQPGLGGTDQSRKVFHKYLYQVADPKDAQTAINQINLFGAMTQLPKGLESSITFSELKLRWDHKNTSFVSNGKIGIGSIGGIQVNKKVDGFVEIIKRNTGDWMMIYLELAPEKYYVFYYVRGALQVSSHNSLFTDPIKEMKSRDRRVKVKAGQIPYNFVVGTRRELQRAQERYNQLLGRPVEENSVESDEPNQEQSEATEEETEAAAETPPKP